MHHEEDVHQWPMAQCSALGACMPWPTYISMNIYLQRLLCPVVGASLLSMNPQCLNDPPLACMQNMLTSVKPTIALLLLSKVACMEAYVRMHGINSHPKQLLHFMALVMTCLKYACSTANSDIYLVSANCISQQALQTAMKMV